MAKNSNQPGFVESIKLEIRALKIWWKFCPGLFFAEIFHSVVTALSPYVSIWLSARLLDELAGNRDAQALLKWVLLLLSTGAALALAAGIAQRLSNYEKSAAENIEMRVYMEKLLNLDFADMDRQYVADLYSQIRQNAMWTEYGLYQAREVINPLFKGILQFAGGVALSVSLFLSPVPRASSLAALNNPIFAVAIFALMLLIAVASPLCAAKVSKYWSDYAETARLGNRMFGFFGFMAHDRKRAPDLRMYCQQENICAEYTRDSSSFGTSSPMARLLRGPIGLWTVLSQCVSIMLTFVIYLFVCLKAWAGAFGVGAITQYVGAITNMFRGISEVLKQLSEMRSNAEFMRQVFEFLDIPNSMYQGSLTTEKRSDREYEVEFRDVSFKYPQSENWALRHVNLRFRVGSRLAVVGVNGSGKTTFIKLLCRLYDPTEGQILLNGIDIRKYDYSDYIDIFSVVFQDFKLLALPLCENVASSVSCDRERALKCLRDAGFDDRLSAMPKGLDTYLYKDLDIDGVEVSGGEAQKIAIARALYKDAPFIILDEPTAALDPIAEAEIYAKFNAIVGDKTAIYISHRLSSCKFCDEIAVFDGGSIIQYGAHDALIADEDGRYYALWNAQAQYYT